MEESVHIKGTIKRLVYHNEENGFVIARVDLQEPEKKRQQ